MFYFAILASLVVCRAKVSRRFTVNGLSVVALVVSFVLFYALPNIRGNWTGGDNGWMYSPIHALMTIPGSLGWGVIVLSLTGALLLAANRQPQHIFAFLCTAAVVPFALLVPFAVNFHPEYLMIVIFPALYSAAWFVHFVAQQLESHSKIAAFTFVAFAALSNFPTLVSHYVDGSRPNFRVASDFLISNTKQDDNIAAKTTTSQLSQSATFVTIIVTYRQLTLLIRRLPLPVSRELSPSSGERGSSSRVGEAASRRRCRNG